MEKLYNKQTLIVTGIITIIVFLALRTFDAPLRNETTPGGIVTFEFAKDIETAENIINSWDENAKLNAGLSIGIDYLFLIAYSLFFSISIFLISNNFQNKFVLLRKIGMAFTFLLLFAGLCDAIENYALIQLLLGSQNAMFPTIAYYFASIKFILIGFGLIYILIGLVLRLIIKSE